MFEIGRSETIDADEDVEFSPEKRRPYKKIARGHHDRQLASRSKPITFWDALDPIEREALMSVASWRTFAADARSVQDGDPGNGQGSFHPISAGRVTATDNPDYGITTQLSWRCPPALNGENCTVVLTDVVAFGARTRTDSDRRIIREALFGMTYAAMTHMPDVRCEDRGDGLLVVVPPGVPTARVLDQMLKELPTALERHNDTHAESARFQLRFAVNVGPVVSDAVGMSGEAIIVAARLVEAQKFKDAIAESTAHLGVIASAFVYETVIRHGPDPREAASYSQVPVEVKESDTTAWMRLVDAPVPSWPERILGS